MGWYQAVHAKSASSQEIRALLTGRRLLLDKLRDVELSLRGVLRGFGLKLGKVTQRAFETRVRELVANHPMLQQITGSMLLARATLQREHNMLHKALLKIVRRDKVCRQFMTAPGVGADCGDHVQDGGRRSAADQEIERGRTAIWINP
jgi:transposase